jgi:hypothetical protein
MNALLPEFQPTGTTFLYNQAMRKGQYGIITKLRT